MLVEMINNVTSKIEQFNHEHLTWQRMLAFFKQENSYLKTRLSKVVDGNTGKEFIDLAEHYQNQFVLKDEFIDDLKQDVNKLIQFLKKEEYGNSISFRKLEASQKRLRNEMESLEKSFTLLKNQFNNYLVSVL